MKGVLLLDLHLPEHGISLSLSAALYKFANLCRQVLLCIDVFCCAMFRILGFRQLAISYLVNPVTFVRLANLHTSTLLLLQCPNISILVQINPFPLL